MRRISGRVLGSAGSTASCSLRAARRCFGGDDIVGSWFGTLGLLEVEGLHGAV